MAVLGLGGRVGPGGAGLRAVKCKGGRGRFSRVFRPSSARAAAGLYRGHFREFLQLLLDRLLWDKGWVAKHDHLANLPDLKRVPQVKRPPDEPLAGSFALGVRLGAASLSGGADAASPASSAAGGRCPRERAPSRLS